MKTIEQELSRIDLNLLVSLSVLLKERNVTRAASALYLSQSAMSRILGKLRDIFHDPLFYREPSGLVPTQKALELEAALNEALFNIKNIVDSCSFSPKSCKHTFAVSAPPLMSELICGKLGVALFNQAPKASLVEFPTTRNPTQQLVERTIDFTLHIEKPINKVDFICTEIGKIHPTFYVCRHHPLASQEAVTLEECLGYRFVDLTLDIRSISASHNPVDQYLESHGLYRDIAFKSGQLNSLIKVMKQTPTILVSSNLLAKVSNELIPLTLTKDSLELNFSIYLIEHKRTLNSPAHQWFRELVLEQTKSVLVDA
ncbi:LysR family transcriptional regulator [Photobacterium sp. DA100]|uniref:LysR family transcriptional regulator n=1 Tax=Photobacterium sp. DA100 TaxID=3027472 RepID=UPI0024796ACE|nr:LysR family transcriptional regulator [Photobacterium sp. DA100]WEM40904.1 LysR family transcriptional regulator [Photobacterium sp. DA100]